MHRRAGGNAVIDHDDGAPGKRDHRPRTAIQTLASLELDRLAGDHRIDFGPADARPSDQVLVEMDRATGNDGAHRQFAMERQAKRSEEHTSELQSLMRNSYAVFCFEHKNTKTHNIDISS